MDLAIQFQKITLDEDRYIFKPIGVIRGEYNKKNNTFISELGYTFYSSNSEYIYEEFYFYNPTNILELKKAYGKKYDENELISLYYDMHLDFCYIGIFNVVTGSVDILKISYESIDQILYSVEENENTSDNKNDLITSGSKQKFVTKSSILENNLKSLKKPLKLDKKGSKKITLKELRKDIKKKIVGQDSAVDDVTREIMINQMSESPRNKSHMIIVGPTGTGKTEIVKSICEELDIVHFSVDATAYTKEGYVGKSVYSMIEGLINAANGDIESAQNGILVIDEIDKKLSNDVAGKDVLYSMLKIMDREIIEIGDHYNSEPIMFDTSNLTIIFMGAFQDLYKEKLKDNSSIGFSSESKNTTIRDIRLSKEDLIKAGVPAEWMGRIGDIAFTTAFTEEDLFKLLSKSKISPLIIAKQFFKETFGIDLKYTSGYINEIAKQSIKTQTNARELKSLVRESLKCAYDYVFDGNKPKVLKLTKETAIDNKKFHIE